jgi:hypothetical protein
MARAFHPPELKSLVEIDTAACAYQPTPTVIDGLVSPSSQGGWPGRNGKYEVFCFELAAWRKLGQMVTPSESTILWPVHQTSDPWSVFPSFAITRVKVFLSLDETRAVLVRTCWRWRPDAELKAIASKLQQPVVIATQELGPLTLDRRLNRFEGTVNWLGSLVRVSCPAKADLPVAICLETARALWTAQSDWNQQIVTCAVNELLPCLNDNWLCDDEEPFSPQEFIEHMTLDAIEFQDNGDFEFWFSDGDMFAGHCITVRCSLVEGPHDAGLSG